MPRMCQPKSKNGFRKEVAVYSPQQLEYMGYGEVVMAPKVFKKDRPEVFTKKRYCPKTGIKLNMYNPGPYAYTYIYSMKVKMDRFLFGEYC